MFYSFHFETEINNCFVYANSNNAIIIDACSRNKLFHLASLLHNNNVFQRGYMIHTRRTMKFLILLLALQYARGRVITLENLQVGSEWNDWKAMHGKLT